MKSLVNQILHKVKQKFQNPNQSFVAHVAEGNALLAVLMRKRLIKIMKLKIRPKKQILP